MTLRVTTSRALGVLAVAIGLVAGARELYDNSFLTHLSTGRLIWSGSGIPRADPYSFTAFGDPWTVQSWFASVLYGGIDELGGLRALRVHFAVTAAAIAALGWRLAAPAEDPMRRLAAAGPFLVVGIFGWTHRPYVLGLLCLLVFLLAVEDQIDARWMLPIGWLWLNTHGGWPLGLAAGAAIWLGSRLDGRDGRPELRATLLLGAGLLVGCLNPYGPKLLAVPFALLPRREAFQRIIEWQAPRFAGPGELGFLLVIALVLVGMRLRPAWRLAVPALAFISLALLNSRNIQVASVVVLPLVAHALRREDVREFDSVARPIAVAGAALGLVALVSTLRQPALDEDGYPVDAMAALEDRGLDPTSGRVIANDFVGNWFEFRYGPQGRVFVDDRVEMYPLAVLDDYADLESGDRDWQAILERYDPDAVVWRADRPLAALLEGSDDWRIVYRDDDFLAAVPAG